MNWLDSFKYAARNWSFSKEMYDSATAVGKISLSTLQRGVSSTVRLFRTLAAALYSAYDAEYLNSLPSRGGADLVRGPTPVSWEPWITPKNWLP